MSYTTSNIDKIRLGHDTLIHDGEEEVIIGIGRKIDSEKTFVKVSSGKIIECDWRSK